MQFAFEAMRADGTTVAERLEAPDRSDALESLRERGLIVLRLDEDTRGPQERAAWALGHLSARVSARDLILFTRQMKMLLEAGSALVPALEAARAQTAKPAMRAALARLQERVEEGDSLSDAMDAESAHFDPVFRTMVAAGEATASLPQIFARLASLSQQQMQTRKMVLGAMIYPLVLSVLLVGVVLMLLLFVVPRFNALFASLDTPLPATTEVLFGLSEGLKHGWPYVLSGVAGAGLAVVLAVRTPATRTWFDAALLTVPLLGPVVRRLVLARVVRVWAAMLRCHVPLLDAIRQSREAVTHASFLQLIENVEESVSSGGRMARALAETHLVDPVIVSAIGTGEENGRLAEAIDFVSSWMDDDNASVIHNLTRLAEPLLLAVMGVVVGFVAMSLFLPLFDLATAA